MGTIVLDVVVDPVVFGMPEDNDFKSWGNKISEIGALIAHPFVNGTCVSRVLDVMVATWYSASDTQTGAAGHELARFAHESAARLDDCPSFVDGAPLLDNLKVDPKYVAASVGLTARDDFHTHLGEAACVQHDGNVHVGIVGPADSWAQDSTEVLVEAEILARDDPVSGLTEAQNGEVSIREFLRRSSNVQELLEKCSDYPCALLSDPDLGVRVLWAVQFGGDPWELDFDIGPEFVASAREMNFDRRTGEARRCLRVMAMIAGGLDADIDGHEDRETEAATSPVRKDASGNTIMRSRLQNKVPDADRIFWARGRKPIFLNVSGHKGMPAL